MQIQQYQHGAVTILKPEGPLVGDDAELFRTRTQSTMRTSFGRLVIDACAVPYVDSKGLEALHDLSGEMSKAGQPLRVCSATETVREVFVLTNLDRLFEHFEDVGSAVRSFL
ncbi:MAG: STAS domain-containing protein [Phycisphaerales bacterium]|jgi:anti-anti-sigma factor